MSRRRKLGIRRHGVVGLGLAGALVAVGYTPAGATHTQVTSVTGSAFGYHVDEIRFANNPEPDAGPTPSVALLSNATNSPQEASVDSTLVVRGLGAATLLTTDAVTVSASGSLGPSGSSVVTSTLTNVNKAASQPGTGGEILTADSIQGSCSSDQSGSTRTTTITNGTLQIDSGLNLNPNEDDDFDDPGEHAPVVVSIPTNPTVGSFMDGHIHLGPEGVDDFRVVFNEQSGNTVTAVHEILGTASPDLMTGHIYLGRSVCGVTIGPGPNAPPVAVDDSYNTAFETPLTIIAPGVLGNDTDADGDDKSAGNASNPPKGSVNLNPDGSFTYTPDPDVTGSDSFTYTVTDEHGGTDTGLVSITIGPPPTTTTDLSIAVVDTPDPVDVRTPFSYTVTVSNLGTEDALGVSVHTKLAGAKFVSASGATCVVVKGKNSGIRCDLGTVAPGGTPSFVLNVMSPSKPGMASARSEVSTTSTDTDGTNNVETETTSVQRL